MVSGYEQSADSSGNDESSGRIRNLLVTITSDSNEFIGLISQMGLGETFDLANPGDLEDKLEVVWKTDPVSV